MRFIVRQPAAATSTGSSSDETEYVEAVKFVRKYGCSVLSRDTYARLHVMHDAIETGESSEARMKETYINALSGDLRRKCIMAVVVGFVFASLMFVLILLATSRLLHSVPPNTP